MNRVARFSFLLGLLVAWCLPAPARADQPFEIDAILSLTGSGAFLGGEEAAAIALLQSRINKQGGIRNTPVKFVVSDDQSSPQVAVQLFNAALQRKPQVIIGSTLVGSCSAIAPLVKNGPVVYCLSAGMRPPSGSYMFAYGSSTPDIMGVMVHYFRAQGWKRIALIFTTDASGQDGEQSLDLALAKDENKGLSVVDREHYNVTDISVSAQLARLKVAKPQVIVAWGTGSPLATVLRGANDIGLSVPFAVSAANLNYALMKQLADFLPPQLLMVSVPGIAPAVVDRGPVRTAASAYYDTVKASGKQPDANMINAWDPTMIVVDAFRTLGFDASAERIRSYIATLHDWYGAAGEYDFRIGNQRGLSAKTMLVVRFDRSTQTFVPVSRIGGEPLGHDAPKD